MLELWSTWIWPHVHHWLWVLEWLTNNFYLSFLLPQPPLPIHSPSIVRQVVSKVAASEDKVAQAEALAQEAEKNPLPQEAGLCSMEVGAVGSHFFHHWGRGIVAFGVISTCFWWEVDWG